MLEEEQLEEELQSTLGRKPTTERGGATTCILFCYRDKKMKSHDETFRIGF